MGKDIIIYHVVLQTLFLHFATPLKCPPGTFLYTIIHTDEKFCIDCPDGTFVPYKDHEQTACRPCEKIKDPELEILISPCNKTHDAVIHCVDGYYRDEERNPRKAGKCRKCSECPRFTGRPCGTYRDTICCWDENFDVIPDHHGVLICKERPWFCRRGQYFETDNYQCLPCPDSTFMPLDYHIQPECWKCRDYHKYDSYRPLHSVIIQPCNRTHGPVIGCADGFFMDHKMSYRDDAIGCSPCTDCSTKTDVQYEGRKCDGMEDTVCCPEANMTVIDTSKGPKCCPEANVIVDEKSKDPVCCPDANMTIVDTPVGPVCKAPIANPIRCGEGQCPHQEGRKRSIDCVPCPLGTKADHSDDTGGRLGNADQSATVHLGAKETFSNNDDQDKGSSGGFIPLYLFVGIVIGVVLSLAFYYIYKKFYRHRTTELRVHRKRSRSALNESTEPEDLGESDPLDRTINETQTTLRHRQVESSSRETIQQQKRLSGSSVHLVTIDDQSSDQCCGNESELNSRRESCRFVKDHKDFIPAKTFSYGHLPEGLREDGKMAYITAVCDLTVRLKVNHTSQGRPKNYPCHELRGVAGAGIKRFGTGLVFEVTKKFAEDNRPNNTCPCRACSVYPDAAKEKWAEFAVVTAAHVVYDNEECEKMSCKLWFDDDDDFIKAPSINGRRVEATNDKTDFRIIYCITHDQEVSQKLEKKIIHLDNLRGKYDRTTTTEFKRVAVLISHQHALSKRISVGNATLKMDGDTQKWSYDVHACPGSCGAPICLLGTRKKSGILVTVHNMENESTGFYL